MDPRAQSYPQLLIDGYITSTFGSQDAEMLYYTLLRRSPGHILASHAPQLFLAEPPPRPDIDPRIPRPPWVIDYVARDVGTVIRQKLWVPRGIQSDFLCPPIFFVHQNGALGLHLPRAVGGDCWSLRGADGRTPLDESASTHAQVRVNWRGYAPWDNQIMVRTQSQRGPQQIIQLAKFAKHLATQVQMFMVKAVITSVSPYNDGDQRWIIGPNGITPDHILLIGAVQVSRASWMPILQLTRYVVY